MKKLLPATLVNLALIAGAIFALGPLFWMVSASFMATGEANTFPPRFLPAAPTWEHYQTLFTRLDVATHFRNSLIVTVSATLLSLLINAMAGYAFAKLRFGGRERIFGILLGALVIPAQVGMLPLFLMLKTMGLVNTLTAAVIPFLASVFGIFLVRQYARGIPDELLEAARIDGAGEWRIFVQIVLPLLKPIIVTLAIFSFLAAWNDFMWPLIVLTGQEHYTLPIGLASLAREHAQDSELMMAGSVVTVLPVLLLFLSLQRYYLQGLLLGSVKG